MALFTHLAPPSGGDDCGVEKGSFNQLRELC